MTGDGFYVKILVVLMSQLFETFTKEITGEKENMVCYSVLNKKTSSFEDLSVFSTLYDKVRGIGAEGTEGAF